MFGELSQQKIEELLYSQIIGRIGCHADGITYVVPISYAYENGYIYGRSPEGMKITMMRKNRDVCFEVDTMHNMGNWQSIISWGKFEELTNGEDRSYALQKLHDRILPLITGATTRLSPEWPFAPDDINSITGVVFRIRLTKKTGRYESMDAASVLLNG